MLVMVQPQLATRTTQVLPPTAPFQVGWGRGLKVKGETCGLKTV